MCKALEDMVADAKIEVLVKSTEKSIGAIHKKYCKHLTPADAADALELTKDEVVKIYQLIELHPDYSDLQLAELVVHGNAN